MRGTRSRVRIFAVLASVLALGALVAPGWADVARASGDRSFRIESLDTVATITPEGHMEVVEQVTYRFSGGPFTVGIRSFETDRDQVVDFTAREMGRSLVVDPPATTPTGEWEWNFDRPATSEDRTFELRYRVMNAVAVGPDVGELYWKFVGSDHPGIDNITVRVVTPGSWPPATDDSADDDPGVLRAWGHGPDSGVVDVRTGGVNASATNVRARQFVELRVLVPSAAFTVTPSGEPRLATVLAEERELTEREERSARDAERRRDLGGVLAPLAALLGLMSTGLLWFGFGREHKPSEPIGVYWREPLVDPPAVTLKNLNRKGLPVGPAIGATLIDLAQRGYLTITAERIKRFGPDRTMHTFHLQPERPGGTPLVPLERRVLKMVLRGQESMSSDDLNAWGKANSAAAAKELEQFSKEVDQEYEARGFGTGFDPAAVALLVLTAVVTAGVGVLALRWAHPLGWLAIGVSPLVFLIGIPVLNNRNIHSATEARRARSTENFLSDFSNLEEAPVGHLILWERHLVDAVTLGVAKDLLKGLEARLPEVAASASFAPWYAGAALGTRRLEGVDSFGVVGTQIASSFKPPSNSSGGGGGFSSGGGGGGGGGGFGAR